MLSKSTKLMMTVKQRYGTTEEVVLQLSGAHHCPGTWLLHTYLNSSAEWKLDSMLKNKGFAV